MMWQNTQKILKEKLPASTYSLWIEPIKCNRSGDDEIVLVCPDRFFCSWISENYLGLIKEILAGEGRAFTRVRLSSAQENVCRTDLTEEKSRGQLRLPSLPAPQASCIRTLHPRYTFDEFVVGEGNHLARTACDALARNDSSFGRCLYISAGTGLGKSHLTHAVAHHIINQAPGTRLHYLTAQQLTSEMVKNIKNNSMEKFKDKYHKHCDVLLVEDAQSLAGRPKTQEELAEILDILMETGKRIIITACQVPREIPKISEGFRSRLSSGLITSINPPDLQTRMLIIRRKSRNNRMDLSDDLVGFLAENVKGDVRQLESAVVGLKAKSSLLNTAPDLTMVKEVIANITGGSLEVSALMIRDFVAEHFKVTVSDLQSKSRKRAVSFPRQVAMYLARKFTDQGLADIGSIFNRDHAAVLYSIRKVTRFIAQDGSVRGQVDFLEDRLKRRIG